MLFTIVLSISAIALAAPVPTILNFTYSGTGCEPNTASLYSGFYEPTNITHFTRTLYGFHPNLGPGTKTTDRTKQCVLQIEFAIDSGYTLRADISGVYVRGFAGQLGVKDSMLVKSNISWIGGLDAPVCEFCSSYFAYSD